MKRALATLALGAALLHPTDAHACGGFFCSSSPVDQNAERIIFSVDEQAGTTDMIVQITYQGSDDAFAWLLPVASVPDKREVFPQLAVSSLDAQSGPLFQLPEECAQSSSGSRKGVADAGAVATHSDNGVTVYVMEKVDAYDVAVIQSDSADATYMWLVSNGYRLSSVMKPYIELYTQQHMLFLALKLTAEATTKDIKPFKMTLPGTTPTIPLRLTAIASEPEMGVVVWILGQQRFEPANADEVTIPAEQLRWRPYAPSQSNWTQLVAQQVDAHGGRAWVVDQAGSTLGLSFAVQNTSVPNQDQYTAQQALLGLLANRPYMTRLYTRLSAEEMNYDPTFRHSVAADVSRTRELPNVDALCSENPVGEVCDFSACGPLGVCADAVDANQQPVAACACAPGSTARTILDAQNNLAVTCQDQRMSFMNPGELDETGVPFTDPCVGFSCGEHGQCVSMNLTPTCVCDANFVAIGSYDSNGTRTTTCVPPKGKLPKGFYNRRPPALADGMTPGRIVDLPAAKGTADVTLPAHYGDVMVTPCCKETTAAKKDGCALADGDHVSRFWPWIALAYVLRRRRKHASAS